MNHDKKDFTSTIKNALVVILILIVLLVLPFFSETIPIHAKSPRALQTVVAEKIIPVPCPLSLQSYPVLVLPTWPRVPGRKMPDDLQLDRARRELALLSGVQNGVVGCSQLFHSTFKLYSNSYILQQSVVIYCCRKGEREGRRAPAKSSRHKEVTSLSKTHRVYLLPSSVFSLMTPFREPLHDYKTLHSQMRYHLSCCGHLLAQILENFFW